MDTPTEAATTTTIIRKQEQDPEVGAGTGTGAGWPNKNKTYQKRFLKYLCKYLKCSVHAGASIKPNRQWQGAAKKGPLIGYFMEGRERTETEVLGQEPYKAIVNRAHPGDKRREETSLK